MTWGEYLLSRWWELLLLAGLLGVSGFFSGTETALFNLSRGQLHRLAREKAKVGGLVAGLMRQPRRLLQTLLLGNMIVNVAYEAISAVLIISLSRRGLSPVAIVALAALPVLVLILVGEVTPKVLAYRLTEQWATAAAKPVSLVARLFRPVVWLLEQVLVMPISRLVAPRAPAVRDISAEELSALLDLSARRGLIGHDANAMLQEILQLTDIRVADVMVPRVDMIAYDVNGPAAGLVRLISQTRLRKIPIYDGEIDNILGVIHAKRLLLDPDRPLRQLVSKVPFVPAAANIERALLQLRTRGVQMAIVVDEYGGLAGLVTLEDMIEEIVGDIEETQAVAGREPVRQLDEKHYLLDGDLAIHEWADTFKIDLAGKRISTIGGFVTSLLGHIPHAGETAEYRNMRFTVEAMRGRRVGTVRLELLEARQ